MDRRIDGYLKTEDRKNVFSQKLFFDLLFSYLPTLFILPFQNHPIRHSDDFTAKRRSVRANLLSFLLSSPINSHNGGARPLPSCQGENFHSHRISAAALCTWRSDISSQCHKVYFQGTLEAPQYNL